MPGERALSLEMRVHGAMADRPRLDVKLTIGAGITALMGPSGAGKTTLLVAVAGLLRPDVGKIALGGTVLFDSARRVFVPPHQRRVALVFQSLALFPHLSAWENVAYGLPPMARVERRARALKELQRAHVDHLADRRPATLSGGEAQRVALGRALATEPRALLLDEPFSALDRSLREKLGDELRALVDAIGVPTLLVTHDRADAERLGSRLIQLDAGRLVE